MTTSQLLHVVEAVILLDISDAPNGANDFLKVDLVVNAGIPTIVQEYYNNVAALVRPRK